MVQDNKKHNRYETAVMLSGSAVDGVESGPH